MTKDEKEASDIIKAVMNMRDKQLREDGRITQWISVDERRPGMYERVLVYRPNMAASDTGPVSVQWGWNCYSKRTDVTHWMVCPTVPGAILEPSAGTCPDSMKDTARKLRAWIPFAAPGLDDLIYWAACIIDEYCEIIDREGNRNEL